MDVVFTPEANRHWRTAKATAGSGTAGMKLANVLIHEAGEKLGIGHIAWSDSCPPDSGILLAFHASADDTLHLARETAFPSPVGIIDLWHALLCLANDTRLEMERAAGMELAHKLHREAACAVLGENTVLWLESIRGNQMSPGQV